MVFTDVEGIEQYAYMGSYGIGITRVMGVIVEKFADDKGLVWPENIAPAKVYLVQIGSQSRATADELYQKLQSAGIETLYDDRDERPGVKFADAELLGIPYRVTFPAPAAGAEGSPSVRGRPGRASEAQESEASMQESGKHMQTTMTERDRGPARRRVLQGMAALGGGMLLAACGHDGDDDDGWRRERIIRTDQQAGTETRLVVKQALELRLAVDESLLIYRRGRSSPEMRRVSGPERRTKIGRAHV